MKYATLIFTKPGSHDVDLTPDEQAALNAEYMALRNESRCVGGGHLQPVETATTVRGDGFITDGPYADTKEVFAGYFVIDAENLDEALEWAQRIPAVRLGGAVEVRPLVDMPGETDY
ncbi:hypothetical protein FZI85_29600 [Mycobacterium sp. CBMA293]|uniref:YciI family protein n=1 Tax=unclassified Mycolicibacterium TaxID=2636767 RepID=UPI0012DFE5B3|nr:MULTISPECIES: YciI family protein [unclassified Mycolicibacterium]MUL49708.1 hypothetical protein [Mycolicibacterium sp. CBMA 360]MUL62620.1 hypothetical protein [Mycolicibacterium sp. CBMA 335]MUL72561.1 hypothetical protein [Mycolicibacterium sp. CBMA 311]MUL95038.1 hypothetical protein [Mycolicibacterium sp. CBMA 230]MUM04104.1 hypothetical protein [Mycolicibacterium sp. CBMA 213]